MSVPNGPDLLQGHGPGQKLAIDIQFTHPAGDELVILPPEVQDQNALCVHMTFLDSIQTG